MRKIVIAEIDSNLRKINIGFNLSYKKLFEVKDGIFCFGFDFNEHVGVCSLLSEEKIEELNDTIKGYECNNWDALKSAIDICGKQHAIMTDSGLEEMVKDYIKEQSFMDKEERVSPSQIRGTFIENFPHLKNMTVQMNLAARKIVNNLESEQESES